MSKKNKKVKNPQVIEGCDYEVVEDEIEETGESKTDEKTEKVSLRKRAKNFVDEKIPRKVKNAAYVAIGLAIGGVTGYAIGSHSGDDSTCEEIDTDSLEDYSDDDFTVDETAMAESEAPVE